MDKKSKLFLSVLFGAQLAVSAYVFYLVNSLNAKLEYQNITNVASQGVKIIKGKNSTTFVTPADLKIRFNELNSSIIIYRNSTLRLVDNKLHSVISFGIDDVNKSYLLKILKSIEKAKPINIKQKNKLKKKNKIMEVSGKTFFIDVYKKDNCYFYEIFDNNKALKSIFKYCERK